MAQFRLTQFFQHVHQGESQGKVWFNMNIYIDSSIYVHVIIEYTRNIQGSQWRELLSNRHQVILICTCSFLAG